MAVSPILLLKGQERRENLIFADAVKQTRPISIDLHAIFLSRLFKAECRYSIYLSRHFKAECRWSIYLSRPIKAGSVLAFIFADALKQTIRNTKKQTKETLQSTQDAKDLQLNHV